MTRRSVVLALAATALTVSLAGHAAAQSYPNKPVRLIVTVAAGGPVDTTARFIAQQMQASLGQPVIVENRAGAGGTIGATSVATAAPDGYTLLLGTLQTVAIAPTLYAKIDYDPAAFVAIGLVAGLPHVFIVPEAVPAKSVREFVDYAKAHPGTLNFSGSLATPPQLLGSLFVKLAGIDVTYIPYKGAVPGLADLLGGRAHMTFDALSVLSPLIKEGKFRLLAVATTSRIPSLPDVPTLIESGYTAFPSSPWTGLLAPAGTPAEIVTRLNHAINTALNTPEAKERLAQLNLLALGGSPEEFAALIKADVPKWRELVKNSGAKVE